MIKLQQYYVFKLTTSRIEEFNYDIKDLSVSNAKLNSELVQIGDNQVFRMIREIKNNYPDLKLLNNIIKERDQIKKEASSEENSELIKEKQQIIDDILFIPDIINVKVDNKKLYKKIFKEGFRVNGITFKRFCSGAGQSRQSIATFCNTEIIDELIRRLNCGLDIKEINIAKYNAYFGLYMSATYPVREPRVCVIPDHESTELIKTVDWIEDIEVDGKEKRIVKEKNDFIFKPNMWDGQGLISPSFAKEWQEDLKLNYLPSQFVLRSSFIKGMVAVFDIHKFAKEIAKIDKITDIYGDEWDINSIDILLSASQFKMHKFYKSWDEVVNLQKHFGLSWGVTKVNSKVDNEVSLLNYQYIQSLKLNKESIDKLIFPTVDWINKICSGDKLYTLLFLLGASNKVDTIEQILDKTSNNYVKAILYNDRLLEDSFIKKKIYDTISTKIDEAKIGRVWVRGNYQFMVSDPYGQAQHAFGMKITGLLNEFEQYSNFWNERNVNKVDALRSPLVDFHEHNILNLKNTKLMNDWYIYQKSGIVYNVWGVDTIRHSDSDYDGDIAFTTDNEVIMNNTIPDLNVITYDKATAKPQRLNPTNILSTDLRSFDSKIGTITNYSTAFITMLANFEEGSDEYVEILQRIKLLRRYIGDSIDQAKGIKTKPFPTEWKKKIKYDKEDGLEVNKPIFYHNKLVADKKPYFMIYVYEKLRNDYREYRSKANRTCKEKYGYSLHELIAKKDKSKEESQFIYYYYRNMPVVKNDSVMNVLCKTIEELDFNVKRIKNEVNSNDSFDILFDFEIGIDENKLNELLKLRSEFNNRRNFKLKSDKLNHDNSKDDLINEFYESIREKAYQICSNEKELANHLVYICYKLYPKDSKDFAWHISIDGILAILESKNDMKMEIPVKDNGGIEYLGQKYSLRGVIL